MPICQSEECEHVGIVNLNQMGESIDHELQSKTGDSLSTLMSKGDLHSTEDCLSNFKTVDHYGPGKSIATSVTVGKDEMTMRLF